MAYGCLVFEIHILPIIIHTPNYANNALCIDLILRTLYCSGYIRIKTYQLLLVEQNAFVLQTNSGDLPQMSLKQYPIHLCDACGDRRIDCIGPRSPLTCFKRFTLGNVLCRCLSPQIACKIFIRNLISCGAQTRECYGKPGVYWICLLNKWKWCLVVK